MSRHRTLAPALVLTAAVAVFALSGCVPAAPEPSPTPAPTTPAPTPTVTPAALTCADLGTALGGSWQISNGFTPDAGSAADQILGLDGIACAWTDDAGTPLIVAVVKADADALASAKDLAQRAGDATDEFGTGVDAYFSVVASGAGQVDAFTSLGYWLSVTSPAFTNAADAQPTVTDLLSILPS